MRTIEAVRRSIALRPVTETYLTGVVMLVLVVHGTLGLGVAVTIFGMTTLAILVATVYGELLAVHSELTSQNAALMQRIQALLDVMEDKHEHSR